MAAAGGRWALFSSWMLLLSAAFWLARAVSTWAPDSPLGQLVAPLLEVAWPLCFGTATSAALLLVFVWLGGFFADFSIMGRWACPAPPPGAPGYVCWHGPEWWQVLATNTAPAALFYLEAVSLSSPDAPPQLPDPARRQRSQRLILAVICGMLAYTVVNYRRTRRWPYPLGHGEQHFWLAAPLMAHCWWSHCMLAEANLSAITLFRRLLLPPLIIAALGLVLGCTLLMVHFVFTDSTDLASPSRWGR